MTTSSREGIWYTLRFGPKTSNQCCGSGSASNLK
jgi:hypothetical protein